MSKSEKKKRVLQAISTAVITIARSYKLDSSDVAKILEKIIQELG